MSTKAPRQLKGDAPKIILSVYRDAAQPLDPRSSLTDLARSVAIVGDMLGQFADQYYAAGKKYTSMLATAGRVLWGIVELSVPHSLGYYLLRNWIKVLTAMAILVIVLGMVTGTAGVSSVGWLVLAAIVALAVVSLVLNRFMLTARWPKTLLVFGLLLVALVLLVAYGTAVAAGLQSTARGLQLVETGLGNAALWLQHVRWWLLAALIVLALVSPIVRRNTPNARRRR